MDSYNKTVWVNGSNPPINAENLNHIESGIEAVNQAVTAAEGRITTSESKIGTLEGQYQSVDSDLGDIMDEMFTVEKTNNKVNTINPAAPSNTDYPTTTAVIKYVNFVKSDLEDYVDEEIGNIPGASVDSGFSQTSTNPVQNKVVTAKFNEIGAGKADKANSLSGYGITNAYNKTEVDYALAHKADKSTTLAGYGITDAYTKSEVDELITDTKKTGNKVNIINPALPSNTDYPTTAAVIEYVNSVLRGLTNNGN